jgi:NAD(P)-dependent dehydrogenase (short-subunit alcohol dehydrogenase family)
VHECSTENWRKILGVNQDGCFFGMRKVVPHMKRHGCGTGCARLSREQRRGGDDVEERCYHLLPETESA